ncbi:PHD finger family [Micractinium conductrix]|uniref:PHD finger family n=1 Tax=Micractinium conductrix TaxID=554055 RepID=A0A2P6VPV6_9CHLO|nr:PHD finger family [Micractinium conductrix]|eukprot:PSC76121.1 PHD finger family [Micractinium conductrix]
MAPDAAYWEASEACVECGGTDYSEGYSPRTLIFCDCCLDRGVHVECWHKRSGEQLTEERLASPAFQWCCGEGCCRVSERMVELTGVKRPLTDPAEGSEYTVELVRWSQRVGSEKKKVDAAKNIFNSAFAPLKMGNGRNLIDMVCEAFETPDDEVQASGGGGGHEEEDRPENFNFSSFRVLLLRKRGTVVSAATVRAFGSRFCEARAELESMLLGMGVEWVIVPAMKGVLTMWTSHFGYSQLSPGEVEVLEERIVMPDPSSAVLVRKQVQALDTKKARAAPVKIGRSVRFGNISYAESEVDEEGSSEGEGGGGRLKKGGRGGKRRRRSTQKNPDSEDEYAASEEEEEEEEGEDSDDGLVDEAEAEAEEGAGGEEDEAGLCASCATRRSESWFSNAAGESLCVSCTEAEGLPQLCQTCGEAGASKRRKTGLMECNPCSSYRSRHKGETRPAHLWPKNKKRGGSKGGEQAGTQATPRPTTPASRAGAGRGPAAPAACRAATGAAPRAPQHARELQATRASLRAISELALTRREVQAQAAMVAMAEAGHTLLLELTVANELGGQLLHLVRAADQQQAEMQHAYEQRLQGATADKQQAEGLFVQRQDSFESAARAAQEATEQVAVLRAQLAASEAALAAGRAAATEQAAELAALRAQVAAHAQQCID